MNWMVGLGGALQQVGGDLLKSELADRLEAKREEKAEQRQQAREERAQQRRLQEVANTETIQRDGQWVTRKLNVNGDVISETPTDPYTIKKLQRSEDKEVLSLEKLTTDNALSKRELEDYDSLSGLERRYKEAQIRERETAATENEAQAARAMRSDSLESSTSKQSAGSLTNQLVKEFKDLSTDYTEGDDPVMTKAEFRQVAQEVVIRAAKRGVDPRVAFTEALRAYARNKKTGK